MEQLTVSTPSFTEALERYIKDIQGAIDRDFETNYPRLYQSQLHPKIVQETGKRWGWKWTDQQVNDYYKNIMKFELP